MVQVTLTKLFDGFVVIFVVVFLTFAFIRMMGDPVSDALYAGGASPEYVAEVLNQLGYDRPFLIQFGDFLWRAFHGDFGKSAQFGGDAMSIVVSRIPATLYLGLVSLAITVVAFVPLGFAAGRRPGGRIDRAVLAASGFALSLPLFVFGGFLIFFLAVMLRWLPVSGSQTWQTVLLPAITLSLHSIARLARVLRSSMVETASLDYVLLGRAKGLSRLAVDFRYVLRNSLLPVTTVLGLHISGILGGAVVVEAVFGWPGIGALTQQALLTLDFNIIQAIVIVVTLMVVVVNVLTDFIYSLLDPRIRVNK